MFSNMFSRRVAMGAVLSGLMLSVAGISTPAFAEKAKVKLGFIGPISGGNAQQGLGAKNGFLLAIEQANANPDGAYEFEGVVLDDASDPQTGVSAAMKLVNDPDVAAATGHWNSPVALATMPVFARFQTSLVVWGAISPAITAQNLPEVTRVTPTLLTENKPLAEWAVANLGKKIAIIADTSDYGTSNATSVQEFVTAAGGEIVSTDLLPVGSTDFRTILTTLKGKEVDAIYFGGVITEAGIAARQMREVGLDKPMLGISGMYDPEFISVAGDAAELAIVSYPAAQSTPKLEKMDADYAARAFAEPASPYTKYAFDATNVIIQAIGEVGVEDKPALSAAIRAISHEGATGLITFDENGQTQTPMEIELKTVRGGEWVAYEGK
ncbi:branched-chain amino acid ABC transporter substrate-binding protein [Xinfangfangia sp. D13-10-4-6]|uniref:branched-chain amino acid ABC transporter substrate-binding protein n=1 Tax=Pseudogemmobacter hezensis TaxID=2737662 RepID=UPI0015518F27|nr:branched-chain amino acid ABC transporter substrate-binding protein [Pseudogemmobacter hezensis]NPD16728.1 branched-chain amino acid ABC transporter substrate-binding protein [Pseudogemmobacter hezensis]